MKKEEKKKGGINWWIIILIILLIIASGNNLNYKECVESCRYNIDCDASHYDESGVSYIKSSCHSRIKNCIDSCD